MIEMGSVRPVLPASGASDPPAPHTLREATQEFESLFLARLMQVMRRTAPASTLLGSSGSEQLFREMLDEEISRRIARVGGLGIGDLLYRQLAPAASGESRAGTERIAREG